MASYIRYDGPVRMSVIVPRVGVLYRALLGERPSSAATGALGDFFSLRDDGEHEVPSARLATGHTKHTNVTPSSPLPFTSLVRQIAVSFDYAVCAPVIELLHVFPAEKSVRCRS